MVVRGSDGMGVGDKLVRQVVMVVLKKGDVDGTMICSCMVMERVGLVVLVDLVWYRV